MTKTTADVSLREAPPGNVFSNLLDNAPLRVLVLVFLFTTAAVYEAFSLSALAGMDVWSHLRTGIWILQTHAVPRNGLFSQHPDLPWMATSWGFDVLLAAGYKLIDLRALPLSLMAFKVALAVILFWLARGSRRNFWTPIALVAVAQYAMPGLQLQPGVCSILLYAVELALVFRARRTSNARPLFWLPVLFAVWANLDAQFVYGLLVLVLLLAASVAEEIGRYFGPGWFVRQTSAAPLGMTTAAIAASLLATLLTPYSYHVYEVALKNFGRSVLLPYLPELSAVGFRRPQDYVLLLLAMAAFFSLGRRRSRDWFQFALMIAGALLSFPAQPACWLVALASVAVIADAVPINGAAARQDGGRAWKLEYLVTTGLVLLTLWVAAISRVPRSREALLSRVARTLPVRACDYIRENHLPGPLFNAYEWGSFLIWYLPDYPVTIDSRNNLYGDEINLRYFKLTHAEIPLSNDVSFVYARIILLPSDSPMAVALSAVPRFNVVYRDDLATVLIPQE
ncbi:MAG: hypothetical protein ABSD98_11135 [Candidatus Korobacteraceae bacterium]|jgi:hypothetical protein